MKKTLIKVLSSAMALSLVMASASIAAAPAEETVKATAKTAAAEKTEVNVIREDGILAAIEAKAMEEAPVVFEAAAPEVKLAQAAPAAEAEAEPAAAEEEYVEAPFVQEEPDMVWDVSATEFDDVAMAFYSDNTSVEKNFETGEVIISGQGAMEESVYRHFITEASYTTAVKEAFEKYYDAEVELIYDETLTDVVEIDSTLMVKNARTGEYLIATPEMMEQLDFAYFLDFSPSRIVIKDGITSISDYAFLACVDVTEVVLPASVKTIAPSAFQQCKNLESVVVPEGIAIEGSAFYKCDSLKTVAVADEDFYANYEDGIRVADSGKTLSLDEINALIDGEALNLANHIWNRPHEGGAE